ncbi:MAG: bacteriophytochrome (light-regulated signal transduction histidine kinase) [uncultured archaeon A07HR67]|nr:MAG: bacteriophytochrome (light-regulated signal transduction histidine kinase) [uncultured archaeon A07HR67]
MPVSGVWWHDEESDTLVSERMTAEASEYISEQPDFERGRALAWDAFDTGEVQVYNDLRAIDSLYNEETVLRSEAIVPLGDHGILTVGSVEQRAFSETDRNLLEVLSSTVEAALDRVERETVLRQTKADLKQSNEELEQFAYAASHDLQEPLRTVSSYLTLLERRYGDELDDDAAEFMKFAVDGADRMRSMIQALLTYSRVDTQNESFESVDISALFERVVDDLEAKITETDAIVSTPATGMTVVGDQNQLAQLFQNLIENGIKYNTTDPEIDVSVSHRDEMVAFEVTDNGMGMETDQIEEIFGVFSRLHTREEFAGTGIGLSICRKIVDRHGGSISVDSEPGVGSTFTLTLPDGEPADE